MYVGYGTLVASVGYVMAPSEPEPNPQTTDITHIIRDAWETR
jgi:hypothetical protein